MQHTGGSRGSGGWPPSASLCFCVRGGHGAALLVQGAEALLGASGTRSASPAPTAAFQMRRLKKFVRSWSEMAVSSTAVWEVRGIG